MESLPMEMKLVDAGSKYGNLRQGILLICFGVQ